MEFLSPLGLQSFPLFFHKSPQAPVLLRQLLGLNHISAFLIYHYNRNNEHFRRCDLNLFFHSLCSCLAIPGKDILGKQTQFLNCFSLFEVFSGIFVPGLIEDMLRELTHLLVSLRLSVYWKARQPCFLVMTSSHKV